MTDPTSPIAIERQGEIALLHLDRPAKRNAFNNAMIEALGAWFAKPPHGVKVAVLTAAGEHFSAGLDLAEHVERSAEPSTFFQLPEGRRGIFVGGGASVRVARLIGASRMTEMMLTGRRYDAADGLRLGLAHYLVGPGEALPKALELAREIAANAPLSNYLMIQAVARIDDMAAAEGLFAESMAAALV